jgi:ankyrin repeat protein
MESLLGISTKGYNYKINDLLLRKITLETFLKSKEEIGEINVEELLTNIELTDIIINKILQSVLIIYNMNKNKHNFNNIYLMVNEINLANNKLTVDNLQRLLIMDINIELKETEEIEKIKLINDYVLSKFMLLNRDLQTKYGNNIISKMITNNIDQMVKYLLDNIEFKNMDFMINLINQKYQEVLLRNINKFSKYIKSNINTIFYQSIINNCIELSKYLIKEFNLSLLKPDGKNNTVLMYISDNDLLEIIIDKLGKNINPNHQNNNGDTILIFACKFNNEEIALKLLKYCDYTIYNNHFKTALYYAKKNNMREYLKKMKDIEYDECYYDNENLRYQGRLLNNKYHSETISKEYNYDGSLRYMGQFKNGKYHGYGNLYMNNNTSTGVFEDGYLVSSKN